MTTAQEDLAQKEQENVYRHGGDNMPAHGHHDKDVLQESDAHKYWQENLKLLSFLLLIWFVVSYLFGIILVDPLNEIEFGGFKLGFWFSQQGSIYVFVALIFVYASQMKKLERKYGVDDDN